MSNARKPTVHAGLSGRTTPGRPQLRLSPGDLLQVKRLDALVGDVLVRAEGPPGRYLVAMVLGVTDKGVPFDVPEMMQALGYQPIPKEKVDEH